MIRIREAHVQAALDSSFRDTGRVIEAVYGVGGFTVTTDRAHGVHDLMHLLAQLTNILHTQHATHVGPDPHQARLDTLTDLAFDGCPAGYIEQLERMRWRLPGIALTHARPETYEGTPLRPIPRPTPKP